LHVDENDDVRTVVDLCGLSDDVDDAGAGSDAGPDVRDVRDDVLDDILGVDESRLIANCLVQKSTNG
jgi:hypothetical protein